MFIKLDRLDDAKDDLVSVFIAVDFTLADLNRMSSPLLDGLWFGLTVQLPSSKQSDSTDLKTASINETSPSLHEFLMRIIRCETEQIDAVRFLLQRGIDVTACDNEALVAAAANVAAENAGG